MYMVHIGSCLVKASAKKMYISPHSTHKHKKTEITLTAIPAASAIYF